MNYHDAYPIRVGLMKTKTGWKPLVIGKKDGVSIVVK